MMTRFFRPNRVVRSGGGTWLVDESWPVAVAIDDDGTAPLLSWPWSTPLLSRPWQQNRISSELDHVTVADGVGIVVRDSEQVAWVRRDGTRCAPIDATLMLAAADPDTAWFVDRSVVDPGQPPASPPPSPPGRIVAVHRDGSRRQIDGIVPVNAIGIRGAEMWVTLAESPHSVLRVSRAALLREGLLAAVPDTGDVPAPVHPRPHAWAWLAEDPATVLSAGQRAGGLVWWAGTPYDGDKIERQVVVVGHDPSTGQPRTDVDVGHGLVRDLQAIGDEVWVAVARRRHLAVPRDRGVDVLAISASGAVRTIHSADSIDISRFAPPLHRPPQAQVAGHIDNVRHQFEHLVTHWRSEDGATSPLSPELSEPSASVQSDWPDTSLIVTLRHPSRPGLVLRRTLALFDETGTPINRETAGTMLMEDLETGYLAPAEEAVDGVLNT